MSIKKPNLENSGDIHSLICHQLGLVVIHFSALNVATLALGSRPKQRACKGVSQEEAWESRQEETRESRQEEAQESHHTFPGVLKSVREYEGVSPHTPTTTPTLGDGVLVDS